MAQLSGAEIDIRNVTLEFAGIRALDDVSFDATAGSLVGVIGPNGAGKTSLFNCISGVYLPTKGDILLDGRSTIGVAPHHIARRGVARMFQNLAVFDSMTTLENLLLGRHTLQEARWFQNLFFTKAVQRESVEHRREVEEIIEFLELEPYRNLPAGMLPYGVLKRIELGRALASQPKVLLLDEPAAGLNHEETEDMARFILDTKRDLGVTQILIEHELAMVLDLVDDIVVLDFGKMIARGTPDEIRKNPEVLAAYAGGVV